MVTAVRGNAPRTHSVSQDDGLCVRRLPEDFTSHMYLNEDFIGTRPHPNLAAAAISHGLRALTNRTLIQSCAFYVALTFSRVT